MGSLLFGYMYSSASVSGQKPGAPIDVAVFPISGHKSKTYSTWGKSSQNYAGTWVSSQYFTTNYVGAIACCMYKWNATNKTWVPYT